MAEKQFNFEQSLNELEDIAAWFESGKADLDQGLPKFERGMQLAAQLKTHLESVENKVEKIKQRFADSTHDHTQASAAATAETNAVTEDDQQAGLFGN